MSLPNLFIVGAPKCGTTALYSYLAEHPQIYMAAVKEPHYFAPDVVNTALWAAHSLDDYITLFDGAGAATIIGEASTWYLFSDEAAKRIANAQRDAHIIAMIRNPVDAVYSLHGHFLWTCNEDIFDFSAALAAQGDRAKGRRLPRTAHVPAGLQYFRVYRYARQLERYIEVFGHKRVCVVVFDDFIRDTAREFTRVLEFLGVSSGFRPSFRIINPAKPAIPWLGEFMLRRPTLRHMIHRVLSYGALDRLVALLPYLLRTRRRPAMTDVQRAELSDIFADDVRAVGDMIGRDLSCWLSKC